ncbi:MAG: TIR domain-containing protein, partial [Bacteroidota bacterium]
MPDKKQVFISYGRKESRDFANRLYNTLEEEQIDAWFDFINIPKGDDFQRRIEDGIESADNFIFVIAPHAIESKYCLHEIEIAVRYRKRIIPLMHIEPEEGDIAWQKIHPAISKLNWINFREKPDRDKSLEEWEDIDDYNKSFAELVQVIKRDEVYVSTHTEILLAALLWEHKRRMQHYLLAGPELFEASAWLSQEFPPPLQAPCYPTDLQCDFICESIKNANNLMTDVFMISSSWDDPWREFIRSVLARNKITCWRYSSDLQAGWEEKDVIKEGIEGADNIFFLVSEQSIQSARCLEELSLALEYNKRVIPIIVQTLPEDAKLPKALKPLSAINFTSIENVMEADPMLMQHAKEIDNLVTEIEQEKDYVHKHKVFLTRALKWSRMDKNDSFLMRGYNLSEAQTWLQEGMTRSKYIPTTLHEQFLTASENKIGILQSEVFISYSQKNADFARKLNLKLQTFGKNTWFDQESLAGASNFEEEILKGIAASENFVFILTPESIASEFCVKEVNFAASQNKRFIPILLEEPFAEDIPLELKRIQWIDFKNKTFETAFGRLIQAINIEREYVKQHTRLQQIALEWKEKEESDDLLLRGDEFITAHQWLDESLQNRKEPAVTTLQQNFITASEKIKILEERKAVSHRNWRRAARVSLIVLLLAVIFFLGYQSRQSLLKEEEAREKAALNYAYAARQILNDDHAPKRALSIAKEATRIINQGAIYKLLPYLRDIASSLNFTDLLHNKVVNGIDFSPNHSNRLILSYTTKNVKIWNLEGDLIKTIPFETKILQAGFSPDLVHLYILNESNVLTLYSGFGTNENRVKNNSVQISANDDIVDMQFLNDGEDILVIYKSIAARLWNSKGRWINTFNHSPGYSIKGGKTSADGQFLLTYSDDKTAKLWNLTKSSGDHLVKILRWHESPIVDASLSADGKRAVTLDSKGFAAIWDLPNGAIIKSYGEIAMIKLTSDNNLVAMKTTDKKVRLEDIKGKFFTELMTYKQFNSGIDSMLLASNNDIVLTYSQNGSAALWKLNGELSMEIDLLEDGEAVDKLILSPKSDYLLKSDTKGTVTIWETNKGNQLASLKSHQKEITEVLFLPDRKQLLTASKDKLVKKWIFKDTLFNAVLASNSANPPALKRNIEEWLLKVNADTLKMAAVDKIRIGLLDDFNTILTVNDSSELYTYAAYFKKEAENTFDSVLRVNNYEKASQLYTKINDSVAYRTIYSEVAIADILFEKGEEIDFTVFFHPVGLNEKLFLAQYISQKWSRRPPLERIEAFSKVKHIYDDVILNIKNNESYHVSAEREMIIKRRAADNCNSLSYYELLRGNISEAKTLAQEGIRIDSTYEWINTKLALAYMYDGEFDKALVLLRKMKGNKFGVDDYEENIKNY